MSACGVMYMWCRGWEGKVWGGVWCGGGSIASRTVTMYPSNFMIVLSMFLFTLPFVGEEEMM